MLDVGVIVWEIDGMLLACKSIKLTFIAILIKMH